MNQYKVVVVIIKCKREQTINLNYKIFFKFYFQIYCDCSTNEKQKLVYIRKHSQDLGNCLDSIHSFIFTSILCHGTVYLLYKTATVLISDKNYLYVKLCKINLRWIFFYWIIHTNMILIKITYCAFVIYTYI